MMSDLVERLRTDLVPHDVEALVEEAADEIERLRAALERLANHESVHLSYIQVDEMKQIALAALEGEK